MPHLIFEYSDNIAAEADIDALLRKANQVLIDQGDVFPIGGIRSRAIELKHYCVADGGHDDAFVHITAKVGSGRTDDELKQGFDALFELVKAHFAELYEKRSLALSMEVYVFSRPTYKHSNVHQRFKKD